MSNKTQAVVFVAVIAGTSYAWGVIFGSVWWMHVAGAMIGLGIWTYISSKIHEYKSRKAVEKHEQAQEELDDLTEGPDTAQVAKIIVADRDPTQEYDVEDTDAWISLAGATPLVYVRDARRQDGEPYWRTSRVTETGHATAMVSHGDFLITIKACRAGSMGLLVNELVNTDDLETLSAHARSTMEALYDDVRNELLTMTGHAASFQEAPTPSGKRAIDVG